MSSYVLPALPGSAMEVQKEEIHTTRIFTSRSGLETRTGWATYPRYRFNVKWNFLRSAKSELQALAQMLSMHRGALADFLLTDPAESSVAAMGFGIGDATTTAFQLQRTAGGSRSAGYGSWSIPTGRRTNLMARSSDPANWTTLTNVTVSAPTVLAPNGANAAKLMAKGAFTNANAYNQMVPSMTNGLSYTCSGYFRAGTLSTVQIGFFQNTNDCRRLFDLTALTSSAVSSAGLVSHGIEDVGGGWRRCWITMSANATVAGLVRIYPGDPANSTAGNLHTWEFQVEEGAEDTAPIPTTTVSLSVDPAWWPALGDGYEPITAPVWPTVTISSNGTALVPVTAWTPGAAGAVSFVAAPAPGARLTWTGDYQRRVRFVEDSLVVKRIFDKIWTAEAEFISVK